MMKTAPPPPTPTIPATPTGSPSEPITITIRDWVGWEWTLRAETCDLVPISEDEAELWFRMLPGPFPLPRNLDVISQVYGSLCRGFPGWGIEDWAVEGGLARAVFVRDEVGDRERSRLHVQRQYMADRLEMLMTALLPELARLKVNTEILEAALETAASDARRDLEAPPRWVTGSPGRKVGFVAFDAGREHGPGVGADG